MKQTLLFSIVAALVLSSCATVLTGTYNKVSFNSNPEGAKIYKDGVEMCVTPCTVPIRKQYNKTNIEFKLDGYKTRIITLNKRFDVVSILNLTNPLFWGVDVIGGAIVQYDTRAYYIELDYEKLSTIKANVISIDTKNKTASVFIVK